MSDQNPATLNWRTIGVKRERNHEALINRLSLGNRSIFQYLKDLMVFAAMVGYSSEKRRKLTGDSIEIILDTYASDEKDGFIYLLGLLEYKEGHILKDQSIRECVTVFEEYCNEGLYTIEKWLNDNPGDSSAVTTLLNEIYKRLSTNESAHEISNEDIEIDID